MACYISTWPRVREITVRLVQDHRSLFFHCCVCVSFISLYWVFLIGALVDVMAGPATLRGCTGVLARPLYCQSVFVVPCPSLDLSVHESESLVIGRCSVWVM